MEIEKLRDKFTEYVQYWDCRHDRPIEEDNAQNCVKVCLEEIILALEPWKNTYQGKKQIETYKKLLNELK